MDSNGYTCASEELYENNDTLYSDGCIVKDTPAFQRSCTNNMTHYVIMMDVYRNGYSNINGYTSVSEELYKQHDTLYYNDGCIS